MLPDPVAGLELGNLTTLTDQQPELVVGWQAGEWLELVIEAGFGGRAARILAMLADKVGSVQLGKVLFGQLTGSAGKRVVVGKLAEEVVGILSEQAVGTKLG